jgi:hypothetical protein
MTGRVFRHGKWIDIETLPYPPRAAAKLRQKQKAFVQIPLWWAERADGNGGLPEILVCVDLLHRAWRVKGKSFVLPNIRGVKKKVKLRVLRELEKAGLIKVEWRPGKSPTITLTPPIT